MSNPSDKKRREITSSQRDKRGQDSERAQPAAAATNPDLGAEADAAHPVHTNDLDPKAIAARLALHTFEEGRRVQARIDSERSSQALSHIEELEFIMQDLQRDEFKMREQIGKNLVQQQSLCVAIKFLENQLEQSDRDRLAGARNAIR